MKFDKIFIKKTRTHVGFAYFTYVVPEGASVAYAYDGQTNYTLSKDNYVYLRRSGKYNLDTLNRYQGIMIGPWEMFKTINMAK